MLQILFAVVAGILTIAAPCILPMLPILLGASVGQSSKQRPFLIVAGFIVSFAATSLILATIVEHLGLSQNLIRYAAIYLLGLFAVFMIWPKPFELLTTHLSGAINKANQMGSGNGNMGGLLLGLVLGVIWTPCAGPILGSILTLIVTQGTTGRSATLLIAYALGAGIPMLIIAYGSQWITTKVRAIAKYSVLIQQIFGVLVLAMAVTMFFGADARIQAILVEKFPAFGLENDLVAKTGNPILKSPSINNTSIDGLSDNQPAPTSAATGEPAGQNQSNNNPQMSQNNTVTNKPSPTTIMAVPSYPVDLKNYSPAPEFSGISNWLNSDPVTMASLKGKVVLVDFWTYSCINCIRTLPYVTKWYDTYKDKGFVVIGVHTPEFAFEKDSGNVADAIKRFGIHYPVAQDNSYGTWQAYNNEYWPAEYLIDQKGNIVYEHFGEGEYDHTENAILELLGMNAAAQPNNGQDLSGVQSPEMYFETGRLQNLTPDQKPSTVPYAYTLTQNLSLNNFALEGQWQFDTEKAKLVSGAGKIRLHFDSGKVYMVAASSDPNKPITLKISVDGVAQPDVTVNLSELYTLFNSSSYHDHTIDIQIPGPGFEAFTFTFG